MYSDEVYIVFTKAKQLGWIRHFIHKEISHCFIIWNDRGQWIGIDNSIDDLSIFTIDNPNDILNESLVIRKDINQIYWPMGFNTCVSLVKRVLGIRNPFIQTPYQLLKRII